MDNDPRETYDERDRQLEHAIEMLRDRLKSEPIVLPETPGGHRDVSIGEGVESCAVD